MQSTIAADMAAAAAGGEPVTAGWLMSGDWKTARAMALHHRVCVIDAEHGAITINDVALCCEVLGGNGCLAIVRVPLDGDLRKAFARRCLDAGAVGILFPNVQSGEEARELVRNCYYPAEEGVSGTRGFGFGGCNADGAAFDAYAKSANSKIVVGVQLENKAAFTEEVLNDIFSVPGLRFTQDGPYDHSGRYLVPGQTSDARVQADLKLYREIARKHKVSAGKHVVLVTPEAITDAVKAGYSFIALGTDAKHTHAGVELALAAVKDGRKAAKL